MRHASVVLRTSVAVIVAMAVGACAAASTSPSSRADRAGGFRERAAAEHNGRPSSRQRHRRVRLHRRLRPSRPGRSIDGRIQVGDPVAPRWFAADDTSLWVHQPTSLVRVDLATSAVTGTIPLPWMDYGYDTTGAGSVWQTDNENDVLVRIDPVTGKVVTRIPVAAAPAGVAVTEGSVWVANEHNGSVQRIDPTTNKVVATIPVGPVAPNGPQIMSAGPGGVWVGIQHTGENVRVDSATNKVGLRVPLDGPVASDGKQVWIGVEEGPNGVSQVVQIDPVSGKAHHRGRA